VRADEPSAVASIQFTPQRERARHDALVERARRATLAAPLSLFCPREPLATALESRVARAGGGFVRVLAWDDLLDLAEEQLALVARGEMSDAGRAALVEAALAARAEAGDRALGEALRLDPYGVAVALLAVLDELRLCGFRGERDVLERAAVRATEEFGAPAAVLVESHLEGLAALVAALDAGLGSAELVDRPARIARALDAARGGVAGRLIDADELFVEGIDRLAPSERALLELVADAGTRVDVAPWVLGWRRRVPRPQDAPSAPRSGLDAFGRAPDGPCATSDDDSIDEITARDPDDEAEGVARWASELEPAARGVRAPGLSGHPPTARIKK
jgi:hypothetical protein